MTALTALLTAAQTLSASSSLAAQSAAEEPTCQRSADGGMRYLILFPEDTTAKQAAREVRQACGDQTIYYPEINVGVATSHHPEFAARIGERRAFSAERKRTQPTIVPTTHDAPRRPILPPTDPSALLTDDRSHEQWNMRAINAERDRDHAPDLGDVIVGVLDSGIDATHPDLAEAVDPTVSAGCLDGAPDQRERAWSPTTSVHGTHVAGIIAAADDGAGVTGVAPGVRLASIKVISDQGYVDPEAVVCGLMWAAAQGMAVTNSSFFVDPWSLSCAAREDLTVARAAIARAVEHAHNAGTLNVAAVTNEAVNLSRSPAPGAQETPRGCEALPASLRPVLAVSSSGKNDAKASYSSYGLGVVALTAPGGDAVHCVLSTVPGGYNRLCGTSMAAPHVTGAVAVLAGANPTADPDQLRTTLASSARPMACPTDYDVSGDGRQDAYCTGYRGYNSFYGYGMVDLTAALDAVHDN